MPREARRAQAAKREKEARELDEVVRFAAREGRFVPATSVALSALAMLVYAMTALRTVGGGDSGELIVAAHTLGVVHPPGYPLYTLLAKAFSTVFAVGSVAWRVNLFSGLCDAIAVGFCLAAVARLSLDLWAGVLAAGLFAFSPLVWSYATTAEVFALNNLFLALAVWIAVRYLDTRDPAWVRAGALVFGLAVSHHHTFVFVGAPLAAWMIWTDRRSLARGRELAVLSGLFALGLLPYVYLPLAAHRASLAMWGDTSTLQGWIAHVLRRDYGTFRLARPEAAAEGEGLFLVRIGFFLKEIWNQGLYLLLPALSIAGIAAASRVRRIRDLAWVLAGSLVLYAFVFAALSNLRVNLPLHVAILARFWQLPELLLFLFAGLGAAWVARRARLRVAVAGCALALIALQLGIHWRAQDQSSNRTFELFARGVLEPLPKGAILLSQGDFTLNSFRYLQAVEKVRQDVRVLDEMILTYVWAKPYYARLYPDVVLPKSGIYNVQGFDMKDFLDANLTQAPVYVCNGVLEGDTRFIAEYRLWGTGLVDRTQSKLVRPDVASLLAANHAAFAAFDPASVAGAPVDSWEAKVGELYTMMRYRLPDQLMLYVNEELVLSAPREVPAALKLVVAEYEAVAASFRDPSPHLFKNLGIAYQKLSETDPRAGEGMVRAWKLYLASTPASDPEAASIRVLVEQAERQQVGR